METPASQTSSSSLSPTSPTNYILVLDIGSTYLKCTIFRIAELSVAHPSCERARLYPQAIATARTPTLTSGATTSDTCEISPARLFEQVIELIKTCLFENTINWDDVSFIGIASQRNTFLVWETEVSAHLTDFLSWKDTRADVIAADWNAHWLSRLVRLAGNCISAVVSWNMGVVMSAIYFRSNHILTRLAWLKQNVPKVHKFVAAGTARIVSLDSWVLAKLTGSLEFLTDYSSVSSWGFFNPATLGWSRPILWLFQVPLQCLPEVLSTTENFGSVSDELFSSFSSSPRITAVVADQQAAAFGHCLTSRGEIKLTLGTGAFITVNSGSRLVFDNTENIYTLIGWKLKSESSPVFLTETAVDGYAEVLAACARRGVCLHSDINFTPEEVDERLTTYLSGSVEENGTVSDDVCQALIDIGFLVVERIEAMSKHIPLKFPLRVDGGVSNSVFLLRIIATLLEEPVARPLNSEMTSYGAALLAGIGGGLWNVEDIQNTIDDGVLEYNITLPGSAHLLALLRNTKNA